MDIFLKEMEIESSIQSKLDGMRQALQDKRTSFLKDNDKTHWLAEGEITLLANRMAPTYLWATSHQDTKSNEDTDHSVDLLMLKGILLHFAVSNLIYYW